MAKFKVVFFDLDGTLADTLEDIAESANFALVSNGYQPYPVSVYTNLVGDGIVKLAERVTDHADPSVIKAVIKDFLWHYDRNFLKTTKPYPGITRMLETLRKAGVKMFVVTNKPDEQAKKIVKKLFGKKLFEGVYGNKEGIKTKPDPGLTLQLLSKTGAQPDEALFIGDSDVDIQTAINAGIKSGGVTWGFRGVDELKTAGANYIFENPDEIVDVVLSDKGQ
ncbi:MAG TPA: HAD family hydrolase [Clostridiales bacterium]|nr:HAD family hydrolase [Clostridiales bacterium]